MIKTALAKLLTVKAGALVLAAGAGGAALAASTGAIPNPLSDDKPTAASSAAHGNPDKSKDPDSHDPHGSPSPSLVGLCHAFTAGAGAEHGKALENPAFTVLITTAGGKDKAEAYCTTLLAASASPAPRGGASKTADSHPTGAPRSHPTGVPSARPSH